MMKKITLLLLIFTMLLIISCSDDDNVLEETIENPIQEESAKISVVLNEIEYLGDRIEILNTGDDEANINDFFLCLGPNTYSRIGALTNETATISSGEFLVITYNQLNSLAGQIENQNGTGGLALYINDSDFADPNTIVDFVQWGATGSFRESVAAQAGIWTTGDFVEVNNITNASIIFDGTGDDASDFAETTNPSFGEANGEATPPIRSIVLNEVEYLGQQVEIYNNGETTVDISNYFLCLGPQTYRRIGDLPLVSGNTTLIPGEFLVLNYNQLNDINGQINNQNATGGLGLYINNSDFTDSNTLLDFVQWGDSGSFRENLAVEAGIWTAGEFVSVANNPNYSIAFDGEGSNAKDWSLTTTQTFGADNEFTDPEISIILNEVKFRADRVELYNNGEITVDVSQFFFCLGPNTYRQIAGLTIESGSTTLEPGEFVEIAYKQINMEDGIINGQEGTGGLGLYTDNSNFGSPDNLIGFVQWGAAGSPRENVAIKAGLWTAGDFVVVSNSTTNSIAYDGDGNTSTDWVEGTTTLGGSNN